MLLSVKHIFGRYLYLALLAVKNMSPQTHIIKNQYLNGRVDFNVEKNELLLKERICSP